MFTTLSFLTSFLYLMEYIPFHFIAYLPFRDRFRLPVWLICCLTCTTLFVQFLVNCYFTSLGQDIRIVEIIFTILYITFYFFSIRAEVPKLLFILVLVVDYVMIIRGISVFLDVRFFNEIDSVYQLMNSTIGLIFRIFLLLLTAPFAFIFFKETKDQVLKSDAPQIWNVIWILPTLTTFVVIFFTYDLNVVLTMRGLFFLLARVSLLIMIFIVYYILVSSLDALRQQAEAAERERNLEHIISLQRLQYSKLQKQIEDTRQARHDLRQHLNLIQAYLDSGDNQALKEYIQKYGQKLPLTTWRSYCANYAVDTVVRYYAEQAEQNGITFEAQINLPQKLYVEEPDICILFGNLLENAVDACCQYTDGTPFIRIHAQIAGSLAISITVDNSCVSLSEEKNKKSLSSKHSNLKTGTLSVRNIATQYNGIADFKQENDVFYASVFLNP